MVVVFSRGSHIRPIMGAGAGVLQSGANTKMNAVIFAKV